MSIPTDVTRLRYIVLALQREGNRMFQDRLKPLGITPSQAEVLHVLSGHESLSLKDIGAQLFCETGSPSRLLSTMVERQLVSGEPSATDRRAVLYSLTERGRLLAKMARTAEEDVESAFASTAVNAGELATALAELLKDRPAYEALRRRGIISDTSE